MRRSSFIFEENRVFIEEKENPSDKVVIVRVEQLYMVLVWMVLET